MCSSLLTSWSRMTTSRKYFTTYNKPFPASAGFFYAMTDQSVIIFDGLCNLCSSVVRFVAKHDHKGTFLFAPMQSRAGQQLLQQYGLGEIKGQTFVLVQDGRAYTASNAALQVAKALPWYWQWTRVLRFIPRRLRDGAYFLIARNRYRWFGRKQSCMIPGPELRGRFLS